MARHIPGPLYFEQLGSSGHPMLLLHSTPDDHRLWLYQTAHFSAWHRTVAVDLGGYGRSSATGDLPRVRMKEGAVWVGEAFQHETD